MMTLYNKNKNKNNKNKKWQRNNKNHHHHHVSQTPRPDHDDFIIFQQFHHQQQRQFRQQQDKELHDQLVSSYYDASGGGSSNPTMGGGGGGVFFFHRPSSWTAATAAAAPFPPITESLRQYFDSMRRNSPATLATTVACVLVFLVWQVVPNAPWLQKYFVCSRQSFHNSHGLSLLLSTVSHSSLRHLAVDLLLLFHLAPKLWSNSSNTDLVAATRRRRRNTATAPSTTTTLPLPPPPLWPLLLGSSLFTNSLFVAVRQTKTCLGLSGVVMALMAYYYGGTVDARQPIQFWIGGILPVSIPPRQLICILCGVSLVGSFSTKSTIAHLVHLGGLMFGLLYYHAVTMLTKRHIAGTSKRQVQQDKTTTKVNMLGNIFGGSGRSKW
jgi:membrane associated rhomboid family serine protease